MEASHPSDQSPLPRPASQAPAMDIVAPPKMAEPPKQAQQEATPPSDHAKAPSAHTPKQHIPLQPRRSGMGLVVAATIVIVLGLGAFMVYAYLRTNGISMF